MTPVLKCRIRAVFVYPLIIMQKKKVLVFGAFDVIHDGHRYFLDEAKKHGDYLIVVVARDSTVIKLKGHMPERPLPNRIQALKKENIADFISPGDIIIGNWKIIGRLKPDIICLGYDQTELKQELLKALPIFDWKIKIITAGNFKGEILHSRHLRNKHE